ncbi:hypothetical protein V502_10407 [Pseudogymnoascus sp. VKM F-4520 (FW-2644)]|nr:hypothetical protein V502_10407 [Pseudogymnoascus sp. VKM F-4520 (FW-2644)]
MVLLRVIVPWTIILRTCLAQQDLLGQLPHCAVLCFEAALPTTTCSSADFGCLCLDAPFINSVTASNAGNCTVVETLQSTNQTYSACGVPIRSQVRLAVRYGFGTDIWGLTPEKITNSLHSLYVAYPFYMTTEAFCQVSILAFYLRFMMDQKTLVFVKSLMVFVTAFGIANTFCMIFSVWPTNYFWDGWKGEMVADSAIDMNLFSFVRGGIEIGLDLVILCLPLPMLAKLHMSLQKKIHIMSMFCVGFVLMLTGFSCITGVSCARLHALVQFSKTSNPTYDNTPTIYWCVIEADLFIIVACMPSIHAALSRLSSPSDTANSTGYDRSDKSSYFNRSKGLENSGSNETFSGISKSTEVNVYRTERSDASDVELVDRPPYLRDFDQKSA